MSNNIGDQPADYVSVIMPGFTKREELIKACLQGFCASNSFYSSDHLARVEYAIKQADALLEALEKEKK